VGKKERREKPEQKTCSDLCFKLLEMYVILVYPFTNLYTTVTRREKGEKRGKKNASGTVTSMYNS
jgi:hypothetical protein